MGIAWVFPGQGSQKIGMAGPVLELPGAYERFSFASELLGRDLLSICEADGTSSYGVLGELGRTRNSQPALFVVESLLVDEMKHQGRRANIVAGHSLGEFVALYAAEVIDLRTALTLILKRSVLMSAARAGAMTAVIGFDRGELDELVSNNPDVVIANDNSTSQAVLSGKPEAISTVCSQLRCKKSIPLAVSGAFHSPFMAEASEAFNSELMSVSFSNAVTPVLSNTDPSPESDGTVLKRRLMAQMTSGVRWRETMEQLEQCGIDTAVEIGPGAVLSGLIKRSCQSVSTAQISSAADLGL